MRVRAGVRTDVGRIRERNEDAYLVREPLFAVADGMGGHQGGDVASAMMLDALEGLDLPADGALDALLDGIKRANADVLRRGESDRALRGMGTTLTAVITDEEKGYVAHVGDSRAYLLRDGSIQRLTRDHTLVERMVEEGRLRPEQARNHPQQNILTRVLGVDDDVEVDDLTLDPIQPGDRILLCTDGLTHMVDDDRIEQILKDEADPQSAADELVEEAIGAGGEDNVTVIVLDIEEGEPDADSAAPEVGRRSSGQSPPNPTVAATSPPAAESVQRADTVAQPAAAPEPEATEGRRPGRVRRWGVRLAVVAVLVLAALFGLRLYVNQQWYVGESAGRVAIYHGVPTTVLGFDLSHVATSTDLSAAEVEQVPFYRNLGDGITADSFEEAWDIVRQMRADLQGAEGGAG
ncbi:MAG: Stp1/IreP family PP2C-type Ser/Thr phosphatase [Actinomycetota bacterium]